MGRELGLRALGGPLIWGKDGEQAMLFSVILNCVYQSLILVFPTSGSGFYQGFPTPSFPVSFSSAPS